ncbi:MAG: helix-turn-helix domain-containing protein [Treponema sp.]|nr:helix-turn-helix domain-containing protein [Treponema sp.]
MIIFFITTQEALCNKIAEQLSEKYNHIVRVFTNPRICYRTVITTGVSKVDMIACDYMIFDLEEIDPFKIMSVHNCVVPFFFYNNPFADSSDRASFWFNKIQKRIRLSLSDEAYSKYVMPDIKDGLKQISSIISSPEINPYVRLMNASPDFPEQELTYFRQRNHIQYSRYKVLSYLFSHKNEKISEEDLCMHVWNDFSPKRIRVLYSYICELRKICRDDMTLRLSISRPGKQCYCLSVIS